MRRESSLFKRLGVLLYLLVFASMANAALTPVGKISYLEFNGSNITIALIAADSSQITSDPDSCGENKKFALLSTHTNYDALAGVLLTYYYEGREDITLDLSGCDGTSPVITQINAG